MGTRSLEAQRVGARIKRLRERQQVTQAEAAKQLGMSTDGYRHLEHGRSSLRMSDMTDLALALRSSVAEVLDELYGYHPEHSTPPYTRLGVRQWIAETYGPELAQLVARELEQIPEANPEEARTLLEWVHQSMDHLLEKQRGRRA